MTQPTIKEVIEALLRDEWLSRRDLANRIVAEGIAPPEGYAIVPTSVLDLTRFMCATWNEIDKWAYTVGGEAIMSYPVIQGSSNQISLKKIGEQPHDNKNIQVAVKWMLTAAKESP